MQLMDSNSVGDIVGGNQAQHTVSWGNDTVRIFNPSSNPLADDDDDAMPQLQEHLHDDDSSSDGSALSTDDFNTSVPPLVPSPPSQNVILNIDQLPSIDAYSPNSIDPFDEHLQDLRNMDLDDPTDFASTTDFLDASLEFLFFDTIDPITRIVQNNYTPKIVLKDFHRNLAVKENVDGTRYYCTVPLPDNMDAPLDEIAASDEH